MRLPALKQGILFPHKTDNGQHILIASEGFEERSLAWLRQLHGAELFDAAVIFKNVPERKSRLDELMIEVKKVVPVHPIVIDFNRYDVETSEVNIRSSLDSLCTTGCDIYIDISVMSRVLIVILLCIFKKCRCNLHIIYSEPEDYAPTLDVFNEHLIKQQVASIAPSSGFRQVIRTPLLSSSVMQDAPTVAVGFTSFNEQLLRALLSSLNPAHLMLINAIPPSLYWRASATLLVHKDIVHEYHNDNPVDTEDGLLVRRSSTLYYQETLDIISDIYKKFCFTHRIVIAPTGSKMQALACGLIKACCHDVHIEYPTPESYFVDNYSSSRIKDIHYIQFQDFPELLFQYSEAMGLNG